VPVDVGQKLGDAERGHLDQRIEMPVAQLRRYDSADLTYPRRQGLELHRAMPVRLADHGYDSPKLSPEEDENGSSGATVL
jgi:hypothetical protein